MATMTARGYVVKDVIGKNLSDAIKKLGGGQRIFGTISVAPGHDYWWFLEYGTGAFHETPDDTLNPPRRARGRPAAGGPYEINAKRGGLLHYMLKSGQRRRARSVMHPGIRPLGFIRSSVFQTRLEIAQDLKKVLTRRTKRGLALPTREELVNLVNETLLALHNRLAIRTPDDSDPDPRHEHRPHDPPLSESWIVTLAK